MKQKKSKEQFLYSSEIRIQSTGARLGINKSNIINWLTEIASEYNREIGILEYTIMTDDELLVYNIQYLNHDTYTDIITFDLSEKKEISGSIFISIDRVKENAKTYKTKQAEELKRVMAHGLLHLIGFKDKTSKDQTAMRDAEDKALYLYQKNYQVPRENV